MRDALHVISVILLMGASVVVAHQLRRGRPAQLAIEILAGTVAGGIPAALLFDASRRFRPDFGFLTLVAGFAVGTSFGAAGSNVAAWLLEGPRGNGPRLASSLAGALAGCFLAWYAVRGYQHGIDLWASPFLLAIAAILVGSFATLGGRLGART